MADLTAEQHPGRAALAAFLAEGRHTLRKRDGRVRVMCLHELNTAFALYSGMTGAPGLAAALARSYFPEDYSAMVAAAPRGSVSAEAWE